MLISVSTNFVALSKEKNNFYGAVCPKPRSIARSTQRACYDSCYNSDIGYVELLRDVYSKNAEDIKFFRRHIHNNPEIGWSEFETSDFIVEQLNRRNIQTRRLEPTGVIADIVPAGMEGQPVVALRADIDALKILEDTGLDYASKNTGVSHACGHDFHVASVFGAAICVNELKHKLKHPVRFIFQPAEETKPSGSPEVIKQGGLDGVQKIYAIHTEPRLEVGKIGIREGAITSAADSITVKLSGNGGHSSRPHLTQDVIQALGAVVSNTSLIFSRIFDPRSVVSMTWGSIHAGNTANAIASYGELHGILRTTDLQVWESAKSRAIEVIKSIVDPYGVVADIKYERGVPPVFNEEHAVHDMRDVILDLFGNETLYEAERSLGGEDFSWYLMQEGVTGAMARMGAATPGAKLSDIHQPDLVVDEKLLDYSVPFMGGLLLC
ncbi:amidohydrolase [Actinomycetota bacterium]|nr:amidohydrolase [Actinomycetota bacterium]